MLFFASVAINAVIGIYAVLAPDFGDTQGKILATSLCVTGAALIALACEPAWERGLLRPVPLLGTGLGALGFGLTIAAIWSEPAGDRWSKATISILAVALAAVVASLLALARLAAGHAWIRRVTYVLLAIGTVFYVAMPWLEDPGEWVVRPFGVVMIALAALAVTVPVLHWVDRGVVAVASAGERAVGFCPYCGTRLSGETGAELTCARCGRAFSVRSGRSRSRT